MVSSNKVSLPLSLSVYVVWNDIIKYINKHKDDPQLGARLRSEFGLSKSTVYGLLKTLEIFIGSIRNVDKFNISPQLGRKLTDDELKLHQDEFARYKELGRREFIRILMEKYGLTYWTASKLYYHEKGQSVYQEMDTSTGTDTTGTKLLDWRKYLDDIEKFRHTVNKSEGDVDYDAIYEWNVKQNRIGVIFTSDWHLGSRFTNYKQLKDHIELLMNHFHVFLVGDMVDLFLSFKNKAVEFQQIVPPTTQLKLLYSILYEMQQKGRLHVVLFSYQRVHDAAVAATAGFDPYQFFDGLKTVYFRNKGTIYINMPNRTWEVLIMHKYGRGSYRNPFNRHVYAIDNVSSTADVIVMAHLHRRDYASFFFGGKQRICINLPGFKLNDPYTSAYFNQNEAPFPVIVFDDRGYADVYPTPQGALYALGH